MMECCNGGGRFIIEAITWWLLITLPINLVSIYYAIEAPPYIHPDIDEAYHNSINETNITLFDEGKQDRYVKFFANTFWN